jgi:hypothetical protein
MNLVGITVGLLVIKSLTPHFAALMQVLDFCNDKTQFVFLVITFLAGTAAAIVKNNRLQRPLSMLYTTPVFFWICMGLILLNLILLLRR